MPRNTKITLAIRVFLALSVLLLLLSCENPTFKQSDLTVYDNEISKILSEMSLEEKVEMFHSKTIMSSEGVPRLGIPEIRYADGPFGIREELTDGFRPLGWQLDSATYFPTGSALAATWDPATAISYGFAMGTEARLRGKDVILGPAINIQRIPVGGRSYEYLSEDPLLSSKLSTAYTIGVQQTGTAVCLKHFALNNQETNRGSVNVVADERTIREIYLPPFEAAVKEGAAMSVMSAYNKVNGEYCSENEHLLNEILRAEWGFNGMVVSDWGGTHSTMGAAMHGLNVQMTGDSYLGPALIDSVRAGKVPMEVIDAKAREILRVRMAVKPVPEDVANTQMTSQPKQQKVALDVARKSIVLLKNENHILPINKQVRKIAVVGQNAVLSTAAGGVGAGVKALYEISPLDGIKARAAKDIQVVYAPGYRNYVGRRASSNPLQTNDIKASDQELIAQAVSVAKDADIVLFFAGTNKTIETEGSDRKDIKLPCGQEELALALRDANPNMVSIIISGGACDLQVLEPQSSALLQGWWNGSEGGRALAEILFGDIAPSGKLPFTFPIKLEDSPAYAMGNFPSSSAPDQDLFTLIYRDQNQQDAQRLLASTSGPQSYYSEGIFVGYRWFDTKKQAVMYPFGHGITYVDFQYSNLKAELVKDKIKLRLKIENSGDMAADEVVQVYVRRLSSSVERPDKELKAFQRVNIKSGKQKTITLEIPFEVLRHWDVKADDWSMEHGQIELLVGSSSADIRLKTRLEI